KFNRQQIWIAALLFSMMFLNFLDRQILSVLAPILRQEIGLSQTQYAWAVNAFLFSYAWMYTGSGLILDRLGSRWGLPVFVALWSLACGLHATIQSFAGLLVFRFLLGITEPGGWTGAVKTVSERFNAAQRGLAAGIFSTGASVATLVAPPLVVFLSLNHGWRMTFLIPGLAGLLWVPLWLRLTNNAASNREIEDLPGRLRLKQFLLLLRDKRVLAYAAARFFGDSSGYFFIFWIPEYLVTTKNFSFAMLGTLGWIPFLALDLGPITGGYLSGRLVQAGRPPLFSRKLVMTMGSILVAIGVLSQSASQIWTVLLFLSIATFGLGVYAGNLHALPADAFPHKSVATIYGLAGSAGAVGGILFNSLVGYLSTRGDYFVVFAVLALLEPLAVAALWIWLRDPASATSGQ
ncbi:MAG: MFS transporter, partial [Acidobacteria bacterium]|nr:MFS transporter [Acidobacteriota bacterium]